MKTTLFSRLVFSILLLTSSQAICDQLNSISLGVVLEPSSICGIESGLCVRQIRPNGLADRMGMKTGDVIKSAAASSVDDIRDLHHVLEATKVGQTLALVVERGGDQISLSAAVTDADLRPTENTSSIATSVTPIAKLAYEIVQPADPNVLKASVSKNNSAVSLTGDVLSIVHRDARESVFVGGSLQQPMNRIEGTDIWYLQLRRSDWEEVFFSYQFAPAMATKLEAGPVLEFRGRSAPNLERTTKLKGRILQRVIDSRFLNERRAVTIYMPPNASARLPVLFMTDGSAAERFAEVVEPLILGRQIKPIAIVGVHQSGAPSQQAGIERRTEEYVEFVAPNIFAAHLHFFVEEAMPSMSKEFHLSDRQQDRAIFGFSNGAAFVSTVGAKYPKAIAHVLAFSFNLPNIAISPSESPSYHFAAGELEPYFLSATRHAYEQALAVGIPANFHIYKSGHDILMWQVALCDALPNVFPP